MSPLLLLLVLLINNQDLILTVTALGPQDTGMNSQQNHSLLHGLETLQRKHDGLGKIHKGHTL